MCARTKHRSPKETTHNVLEDVRRIADAHGQSFASALFPRWDCRALLLALLIQRDATTSPAMDRLIAVACLKPDSFCNGSVNVVLPSSAAVRCPHAH